MHIYLIRHGETDWNREGRRQGRTDIPLNDIGRQQIRHAAYLLGQLCPDVDSIYSSPLSRALESAEIVAQTLHWDSGKIQIEPLLIERDFGLSEGLYPEERRAQFPDDEYTGMEPMEDFLNRAQLACRRILRDGTENSSILVVSHYVILSAIVGILTEGRIPRMVMEQGCVYQLEQQDAGWQVTKYAMQTF